MLGPDVIRQRVMQRLQGQRAHQLADRLLQGAPFGLLLDTRSALLL